MNDQISLTDRLNIPKLKLLYQKIPGNNKRYDKLIKFNSNKNFRTSRTSREFKLLTNTSEKNTIQEYKMKSLDVNGRKIRYFKSNKLNSRKYPIFSNKSLMSKRNSDHYIKFENSSSKTERTDIKSKTINTFIDPNNKNNVVEINDLLKNLIKIKHKINEINIKKNKINSMKFSMAKQINSKTKKSLNKNNYTQRLLIDNKNNKTEIHTNLSEKKMTSNKFNRFGGKQNLDLKFFSVSKDNKKNYKKTTRTISFKKEKSTSTDMTFRFHNNNNSQNILNEHIKYIDKIRNSELIYLFERFQKALKRSKQEEIIHVKSLVFPAEIINHIIRMKKELIYDKFRNEYLKKIDTYRYNSQKILKTVRNSYNSNNNNDNNNNNKLIIKNDINSENKKNKNNVKLKLIENINGRSINIFKDDN